MTEWPKALECVPPPFRFVDGKGNARPPLVAEPRTIEERQALEEWMRANGGGFVLIREPEARP